MVPTMICLLTFLAVSIQKCGIHRAAVCRTMITLNVCKERKCVQRGRKEETTRRNCQQCNKGCGKSVPAKSHETFSFLSSFLPSSPPFTYSPPPSLSFLSFLPSSFTLIPRHICTEAELLFY